jgi:hypothetical protein
VNYSASEGLFETIIVDPIGVFAADALHQLERLRKLTTVGVSEPFAQIDSKTIVAQAAAFHGSLGAGFVGALHDAVVSLSALHNAVPPIAIVALDRAATAAAFAAVCRAVDVRPPRSGTASNEYVVLRHLIYELAIDPADIVTNIEMIAEYLNHEWSTEERANISTLDGPELERFVADVQEVFLGYVSAHLAGGEPD